MCNICITGWQWTALKLPVAVDEVFSSSLNVLKVRIISFFIRILFIMGVRILKPHGKMTRIFMSGMRRDLKVIVVSILF